MAEPSRRAWETALRKDIARIAASVQRADERAGGSTTERTAASRRAIGNAIEEASGILDTFHTRPALRRMVEAGSVYDAVLARVQRADEDLLLIAAPEEVIAEVPALRAGVHRYLVPVADPRAEGYLQFLNNLAAKPTELSDALSPSSLIPAQNPGPAQAPARPAGPAAPGGREPRS